MTMPRPPFRLAALVLITWSPRLASAASAAPELDVLAQSQPKLVVVVRNPASTKEPSAFDPEPPVRLPGALIFAVKGSGSIRVRWRGRLLGAAGVSSNDSGFVKSVVPTGGSTHIHQVGERSLSIEVPPLAEGPETIGIEFSSGGKVVAREVMTRTEIVSGTAFPIGNTLIADVSLVDGHAAKTIEDLDGELSFSRTYSSRSFERGPLGPGWSHRYLSSVFLEAGQVRDGPRRYLIMHDGSGQVFTCSRSSCAPQRGYSSTLREEPGRPPAIVFRAKNGKKYRYVRREGLFADRFRLESTTDSLGRRTEFVYGGEPDGGELVRVLGPGHRRYLLFTYESLAAGGHVVLSRVELHDNPLAPRFPPAVPTGPPVRCVHYSYDSIGRLTGASRYDGPCTHAPSASERYEYANAAEDAVADNLVRRVDWSGKVTTFEYATGPVPGDENFPWMGDPRERVVKVEETGTLPVRLTYSLVPSQRQIAGRRMDVFETHVRQGNSALQQPEVYEQDAYGLNWRHTAPDKKIAPVELTLWNVDRLQTERRENSAGAFSAYHYDVLGLVVDERLGKSASGPFTVEKWSYDPGFANVVCHLDPHGQLTRSWVDSDGSDPRVREPIGTGLVLRTIEFARRVDPEGLRSDATCLQHAEAIAASPEDRITQRIYCGIGGVICVPGHARGELAEKRSGTRSELNRSEDAATPSDVRTNDAFRIPHIRRRAR